MVDSTVGISNNERRTGECRISTFEIRDSRFSKGWRQLGLHSYVKVVIVAGLFCFLFRSEIDVLIRRWLTDASWSHGILIPVFSLYFINQHKIDILNLHFKPDYLGLFLLIFWILFYFFNVISPSGYAYFRAVSIIGALGSIVLFLGGWHLIKHTWLAIAFLIFAVPLPQRYYVGLTMPMRHFAAGTASALLNLAGDIEAGASGVIIDIIYKGQHLDPPLNVEEACSGMRLLMALLALGVAMAYLHYRPAWQRIILLILTIPIAIFCNVVRVTITGFIYVLVSPIYTQGIYHDALGLAMLPLAFACYGFAAWFMSSLFVEESCAKMEDIVVSKNFKS